MIKRAIKPLIIYHIITIRLKGNDSIILISERKKHFSTL